MYSEELFIESFANEIRRKREEQSLSLNQLAEKSSVSASFTMRLENGKRKNASIEVIFKLANALEIDIGDLVQKCQI
ncbi:helix-turn-helix transcriptional regulator [Bacillus sp. Gen3]|nr:helix-turn-helix transcriptional regulator [Bacillus sp. Gen3]